EFLAVQDIRPDSIPRHANYLTSGGPQTLKHFHAAPPLPPCIGYLHRGHSGGASRVPSRRLAAAICGPQKREFSSRGMTSPNAFGSIPDLQTWKDRRPKLPDLGRTVNGPVSRSRASLQLAAGSPVSSRDPSIVSNPWRGSRDFHGSYSFLPCRAAPLRAGPS